MKGEIQMFGAGRPFRPGRRSGFGYRRGGNFFLPFTLGALTGAVLTPPYRPYYNQYQPYYPYPYPYPYYYY